MSQSGRESLRAVYRAETAEIAEQRLAKFEAEWGKKYPAIGLAWRRVWNEVIPFFAYPPEVRRMIYTTDEIDKSFLLRDLLFYFRVAFCDVKLLHLVSSASQRKCRDRLRCQAIARTYSPKKAAGFAS
jgi:transposase-like protein